MSDDLGISTYRHLGVAVQIMESDGVDGAVVVQIDTSFEPNGSDGPGLRVALNDSDLFEGVPYVAKPEFTLWKTADGGTIQACADCNCAFIPGFDRDELIRFEDAAQSETQRLHDCACHTHPPTDG